MFIQSTQNEIIKRVCALARGKAREEQGLHFIEGERLVRDALKSGARLCEVFAEESRAALLPEFEQAGARAYEVSRPAMEKLCDTRTPQGVCATVATPSTMPPEQYPAGLIVALDRVQDPGNEGTILRTADALGAAGVFFGTGCADPFSPKSLRAAMGSTYHLPLWQGELAAELPRFKAQGFSCVCGHLAGSETLPPVAERCVLVIGNEGNGASDAVSAQCALYRLSMRGNAESLNASIAAALLMYELLGAMPQK